MYELADHELDAVAAGQPKGNAFGLVAVGLNVEDIVINDTIDINGNRVNVLNDSNVLVGVPIGIAVSVLGASANAIRQGQVAPVV